jgi:thiamine-monophosphate kinase
MQAVSAAIGSDPIDFILSGGDDYCLLATFPAQAACPEGFTVIGSVVEMAGEQPEVRVDGRLRGQRWTSPLLDRHNSATRG